MYCGWLVCDGTLVGSCVFDMMLCCGRVNAEMFLICFPQKKKQKYTLWNIYIQYNKNNNKKQAQKNQYL